MANALGGWRLLVHVLLPIPLVRRGRAGGAAENGGAHSAFRTVKSSQAAEGSDVRPELKIGLLAKKWREERNFWIAAMGFTLWCMLTVLFSQVTRMVKLEDEAEELRDEVADLKGEPRPSAAKQGPDAKTRVTGAVSSFAQHVKSSLPGPARGARRGGAVSPPREADTTPAPAGRASPLTRRAAAAVAAGKAE
ncbi:hypothetical protein Rsub_01715 [Raphidocelis subcapitata]|uniref:Uncharacterized protein n=1 Tax=Raphidocelis subcapitata TaxID=307507 RepID=A0A2V0NMS3_9CHLO|nr:hypothetical protein Rsub_01715 [Raphidocelis subcapitata]|eukprot:GBF88814.1 hypothetical protein Rsub_01715 [Raphidocelis subcapitata]